MKNKKKFWKFNNKISNKKIKSTLKTKISIPIPCAGYLNIKSTINNLNLNFTDLLGKTKYKTTCGEHVEGKKSARSDYFVTVNTISNFTKALSSKNIKKINLKFNGSRSVIKPFIKGFNKRNLQVNQIHEFSSVPHNGCRLKKFRRI